ncbi:MAG: hypothetical protein LBU68_00525 [Rickettsiales bacterium]|nr:hypothetical protein [Rickettsiales bacterium]
MNLRNLQSLFLISLLGFFAIIANIKLVSAGEEVYKIEDEYTMYEQYKEMNAAAENLSANSDADTYADYDYAPDNIDTETEISVSITSSQDSSDVPVIKSANDNLDAALQAFTDAKKYAGQQIPDYNWNAATALASPSISISSSNSNRVQKPIAPVLLNDARGTKKNDKITQENVFSIIQEIHYLKSSVRDMFIDKEAYIQKGPYKDVNNISLMQRNIIPLKFLSPVPQTVVDIQQMSDPWGYTMVNRFGGAINIDGVGPDYKFFRITYTGLPSDVCAALLMAKWEDNYLGTMWIGANGKFYSWARELQANPMPVAPQDAYAICGKSGYFQIGFK